MSGARRLPLNFDPRPLQAEVATVAPEQWIEHFNSRDYQGEWHATALRGPAGATHPILSIAANPGTREWENTALAERCPALSAVMATFECPLQSVRLLRLGAGARILEHSDPGLSLEDGEVRIHVPVFTSPEVEFVVDGERVQMNPGETWYVDVSRPHRLTNAGSESRVHLVLDCVVDEWLRSKIA